MIRHSKLDDDRPGEETYIEQMNQIEGQLDEAIGSGKRARVERLRSQLQAMQHNWGAACAAAG